MNKITIEQFGKDHWSLLLYIETRIHNYKGILDSYHMRIKNPAIRPGWKPEYGTRLFGYWNKDNTTNSHLLLPHHDDYDCLDDLEAEKLIKNIGTGLRPVCEITKKGAKILTQLLLHKQSGGQYSNFIPNKKETKHETISNTKS